MYFSLVLQTVLVPLVYLGYILVFYTVVFLILHYHFSGLEIFNCEVFSNVFGVNYNS